MIIQKSSCLILTAYVQYIPFPIPRSFQNSGLVFCDPLELCLTGSPKMGWLMWSMVAIEENMYSLVSSAPVSCGICFLTFTQYFKIPSLGLLGNSCTAICVNTEEVITSCRHLWYRSAPQHGGMEAFPRWLSPSVCRPLQKENLCISFPEEEY